MVMKWVDKSRENQLYLIELKKLWVEATHDQQRSVFESQIDFHEILRKTGIENEKKSTNIYVRFLDFSKKAAIWLLIMGFTFGAGYIISRFSEPGTGTENRLVADVGHVSQIVLEDGTKVWLNSGSEMTFPTRMKKERKVRLTGEAYFEVERDPERPFLVEFNYGTVEVIGTRFDISCYPEDETVNTILVEGNINWILPDAKTLSLTPGEKISIDKNTREIRRDIVDSELYYGWIENRFIFNNDKLSEIIKELERWYKVEFIIKDRELESQKFSGIFPKTVSVKSFLEVLSTTGIKYRIIEGPDNKETIELYR